MPVSRGVQLYSRAVAMLCILAMFSSSVLAQSGSQPASAQASVQTPAAEKGPNGPTPQYDYSKPAPMWSVRSYTGKTVPAPVLANTPRIDQMVRDGVLYLSLNDAIALALENNLDIAIARYNLNIADTDILRTKAGSAARGVNTGLVSGTVGGSGTGVTSSTGSGAGGTSTGTGGAGSGSSGIVASTSGVGPTVDSFDPILTASTQFESVITPQSNSLFSGGLSTINQKAWTNNVGYAQGWATGSALNVVFDNTRTTSNSPRTTFSPQFNSNFRATARQHLLQGWGLENNRRFIIQAKNNKKISDTSFKAQIISTVSQIQNIYWDLVNAYENMKVQQRSLEFANRTLSDNRKQVEIGTLAPIEIVRAQSQVATSTQSLIVAQTNLQYQELVMKNAVTRNLDATLGAVPVVPTDTMTVSNEVLPPAEELVKTALQQSPDVQNSLTDLQNRDLTRRTARNAMKPSLDLVGFYGSSSIAGTINPASTCAVNPTLLGCIPPGSIPGATGYGSAFGDLFNNTAPDKGVALQLNIPLRNRAAQADQVRSELEYRQAQMRLQQLQNTVGISVRNAAYQVQQNKAGIAAAQAARDLAMQSLDAEQKKYALGASTSYLVLQASRDEAQAESNLVAAMAAYEKARVALDQVTAATLEKNGIQLQEAVTGSVTGLPSVPGVVRASDASIQSTQQMQQQMQQTPDQQIQQLQQQMQVPSGLPQLNQNPNQPQPPPPTTPK
jgi:outer membrane protein